MRHARPGERIIAYASLANRRRLRHTASVHERRRTVFLLSPASSRGRRAQLLLGESTLELAVRLRGPDGVAIGEVFQFISSLYFRGKLAYVNAFAGGTDNALIITPSRGLLAPSTPVTRDVLEEFARASIDPEDPIYREPLERHLAGLPDHCAIVLLGSVASSKYASVLLDACGERVLFPATFIGRGDMSRGGVMLRAAAAGQELDYISLAGAVRRGPRPPRLEKL